MWERSRDLWTRPLYPLCPERWERRLVLPLKLVPYNAVLLIDNCMLCYGDSEAAYIVTGAYMARINVRPSL